MRGFGMALGRNAIALGCSTSFSPAYPRAKIAGAPLRRAALSNLASGVMQVPLSDEAVERLKSEVPLLPSDYLDYLRESGWGRTDGGYMLYSGPIPPSDVYAQHTGMTHIVLLGDDFNGYCLGFDLKAGRYGEMSDSGDWEQLAQDMTPAKFLQRFS